jgi:hypothetical protein
LKAYNAYFSIAFKTLAYKISAFLFKDMENFYTASKIVQSKQQSPMAAQEGHNSPLPLQ